MNIRISVAARCRVKIDDKYALIVSLNGLERGKRSLAPIGGGVKTTDLGKRYLIEELGADPSTFEKGNDLRFRLPEDQLDEFRAWLKQTAELERDTAAREFCDEVVMERPLLSKKLALQVTFKPFQLHEGPMRLWSYLGGQMKLVDSYGFEQIYNALLPPEVRAELVQAAEQPNPLIELVTAQEIRQGHSKLSKISDWTRFVL
jgi:hypothetical protein